MTRRHVSIVVLLALSCVCVVLLSRRVPLLLEALRTNDESLSADRAGIDEILTLYGPKRYSWKNEEVFIRAYFEDRREGVFLDVGAGPYAAGSNTYFLEEHLGWSGVAIDAQHEYAADYETHRPRTRFFALFVSDESNETATLFIPKDGKFSQASGEADWMRGRDAETREVPTVSLDDLLTALEIDSIDLLSMDIELWEPKALAGFDIERFRPDLVVVESHEKIRSELATYFEEHRYAKIESFSRWDGRNAYYVPAEDLPAFLARPFGP